MSWGSEHFGDGEMGRLEHRWAVRLFRRREYRQESAEVAGPVDREWAKEEGRYGRVTPLGDSTSHRG